MKKSLWIFLVALVFVVAQSIGYASTFTFGDNTVYWSTWGNGTGDDTRESIGIPDFPDISAVGGTIDDNGYLTEVYFNYKKESGDIKAGDVFIDVDADSDWDYVIRGEKGVYQVLQDGKFVIDKSQYATSDNGKTYVSTTGYGYITSTYYYSNFGGNYREYHPVQALNLKDDDVLFDLIDNSITFKDFDDDTSTPVLFSNLDGINIGTAPFIIGFAPTCANDVILTPEPMTVLLLGLGLLGLGLGARRKSE